MNISVKRSGGFAGLTESIVNLDTTHLDTAKAQHVEQLVQSLGFFSLPLSISGGGIGADLFHYEITITDGGRQHTVTFDDDDGPETARLRTFVDELTQMH